MLEAILFGVIQGLSEFLPVSSSGHLALAMHLLDWQQPPIVMELVVHVGTLAAVFVVYGKDLLRAFIGGLKLVGALFRGKARQVWDDDDGARLAVWVTVATIPTGAVALLVKDWAEHAMGTPLIVGVLLSCCGGVLLASRWIPPKEGKLNLWRALLVGLVQGIAVFPGISRSGTTIVAGLALGLSRSEAARFSFIASVPAIVGATILSLDAEALIASAVAWGYLVAGVTAAFVGWVALKVLVGLVRRGALWWFALYMLPLGIVVALLLR